MKDHRAILDLLDQPPSEAAWAAFVAAMEQVPDSDLEDLLPALLARLASWPDHVRVAPDAWLDHSDEARLQCCRVFPVSFKLGLMDVFLHELRDEVIKQEAAIQSGKFETSVTEIGDAFFASERKYVRGLYDDTERSTLYALQSSYPDFPENRYPGYDHLFRINYETGETLRLHSFRWEVAGTHNRCLLIEALAPDVVLLVLAHEKYRWVGQADLYLFQGKEILFEHHWEGRHDHWGEIKQDSVDSIFRLSLDRKCLWGFHYTGNLLRLDLETLALSSTHLPGVQGLEDISPYNDGVLLSFWDKVLFVDAGLNPQKPQLPPPSAGQGAALFRGGAITHHPNVHTEETQAGTFSTVVMHQWDTTQARLVPKAYLTTYFIRRNHADFFVKFRYKCLGTHWLCAFLCPPDFMDLIVVEFPTGRQARLCLNPSKHDLSSYYLSGIEAYDFDASGTAIVFDTWFDFRRWEFELRPGDVMQRLELNPT
jgi:hypothetical protein